MDDENYEDLINQAKTAQFGDDTSDVADTGETHHDHPQQADLFPFADDEPVADVADVSDVGGQDYSAQFGELNNNFQQYQFATNRMLGYMAERLDAMYQQNQQPQQADDTPPVPDRDEEPISYMQHSVDATAESIDRLNQRMDLSDKQNAFTNAVNQVRGYVEQTESVVLNEQGNHYIPDYHDAVNYLYESTVSNMSMMNPGASPQQIQQSFDNWYLNFAADQMQRQQFLPHVLYNWALRMGYRPADTAPVTEQDTENTVVQFNEAKAERGRRQVPDVSSVPSTRVRDSRPAAVSDLQDLNDLDDEEFHAFMDENGFKGGIRAIRQFASAR